MHVYFTYTTATSFMVGGNWAVLRGTHNHRQVAMDLSTYAWRRSKHELNLNSQRLYL